MATVNLQPAVYTMRETSQPAPIAAAWTGYRVPEASSVAMKGVRFSVKLACARWAVMRTLSVFPSAWASRGRRRAEDLPQLSWYAAGLSFACSAVAYVLG